MLTETYRPAAQMADCVFDNLVSGVAEEDTSVSEVFIDAGVTVVGIHGVNVGGSIVKAERVAKPRHSKKCCDK